MKKRTGLLSILLASLALGCGVGKLSHAVSAPAAELPRAATKEVSIPAEGVVLRGTLQLPGSLSDGGVPAVLLIAGSGPQPRDPEFWGQNGMTFGFAVRAFRDLTETLLSQGFAVLAYDKRTCGPVNGCADNGYPAPSPEIPIDVLISDAQKAVGFLRSQPDVNANQVFVVGHSQGAKVALAVMGQDSSLRAGVLLAANFSPIDTVVQMQLDFIDNQLQTIGTPSDEIGRVLARPRALVDQFQKARTGGSDGASIFLRSWMTLDERSPTVVRNLRRPLLFLGGTYDWNIPPSETEAWAKLVNDVQDSPGHQVHLLSCVTHALNCVSQPDPTKIRAQDIGRNVDASVREHILNFLAPYTDRGTSNNRSHVPAPAAGPTTGVIAHLANSAFFAR